ncbi:MAG: hypothetical protein ACI88A_003739 [Paraglaciecola sp.]|jgi:hypothetical protein
MYAVIAPKLRVPVTFATTSFSAVKILYDIDTAFMAA